MFINCIRDKIKRSVQDRNDKTVFLVIADRCREVHWSEEDGFRPRYCRVRSCRIWGQSRLGNEIKSCYESRL